MTSDAFFDDQRRWAERAARAQAAAAHAYARLLRLAEDGTTDQAGRIARFIAATWNGAAFPQDLFELRTVDVAIADDMLACIDALRWGKGGPVQAGAIRRGAGAGGAQGIEPRAKGPKPLNRAPASVSVGQPVRAANGRALATTRDEQC